MSDVESCPHCGSRLLRWSTPPDSSWGGAVHLVCFNDDCVYYRDGWDWMMQQYQVNASYRYRYDPQTGYGGPLPVWSAQAHRDWIVEDVEEPGAPA